MKRYVCHYTGVDTLFAILRNCKDQHSAGLKYRASSIYNMNDPTEMEAGHKIVKRYMTRYEIEQNVPNEYRLSVVYKDATKEEECKNSYILKEEKEMQHLGLIPYVTCFSEKIDYLPMWSMYGKGGKGVCIVLDTEILIDNCIEGLCSDRIMCIEKVGYGNSINNTNLRDVFDFLYKCLYLRNYEMEVVNPPTIDEKMKELANLCSGIAPFIKYKDYSYEREVRLVLYQQSEKIKDFCKPAKCLADVKKTLAEYELYRKAPRPPYIEFTIPVEALKKIIVGPCSNDEVLIPRIRNKLDRCKITISKKKVTKSRIPFRIK